MWGTVDNVQKNMFLTIASIISILFYSVKQFNKITW